MKGADGVFEDDALIVALAQPLGLDTVIAGRLALIALDAAFPTSLTRSAVREVEAPSPGCPGEDEVDTY